MLPGLLRADSLSPLDRYCQLSPLGSQLLGQWPAVQHEMSVSRGLPAPWPFFYLLASISIPVHPLLPNTTLPVPSGPHLFSVLNVNVSSNGTNKNHVPSDRIQRDHISHLWYSCPRVRTWSQSWGNIGQTHGKTFNAVGAKGALRSDSRREETKEIRQREATRG